MTGNAQPLELFDLGEMARNEHPTPAHSGLAHPPPPVQALSGLTEWRRTVPHTCRTEKSPELNY